ncbi:MAG: DUF6789 family protein [Candidatus Krumholzibacteriia bacterium]
MKRLMDEQIILGAAILGMAGIAPNIFPVAQAGIARMSVLGSVVLLPSLVLLAGTVIAAMARGHHALVRRVLVGTAAGILATVGLEIVRITSFRLGGMPGDLPRLMGVLLTDRFMVGPSTLSDVLGWAYHFWNGAVFGLIFAVLLGSRHVSWHVGYGVLVGVVFLASPAVSALGIGAFGLEMPSMPATVLAAHVVYGWVLGKLHRRWTAPLRTTATVGLQRIGTRPRPAVPEFNPEGDRCA